MIDALAMCDECGEPCSDPPKVSPWSGQNLCAECHYDDGIQAEDRHWEEHDAEPTESGSEGSNG